MGDRVQVHIFEEIPEDGDLEAAGVWLYSHSDGDDIINIVRSALRRGKPRFDGVPDAEYMTRVVFCEMIKDDVMGLLSYGIGRGQHGDVDRVVEINCGDCMVKLLHGDPDEKVETAWEGTIEDFVASDVSNFEVEEQQTTSTQQCTGNERVEAALSKLQVK